ncbi:MAG: NAD(P)H-hydrate dehydratase [Candidatus Omnitrophica bacterium]|nr:NAD(P)H-hydrate dehydratase [Candidatus Omnitrophota bacterium]
MKRALKIKKRPRSAHKGDYGHVLVIAGSLGMTGAAYLCCEAAILSGAGLVTLGLPKSLNPIMERKLTEVMTLPLPETKEQTLARSAEAKITAFAKRCDCLAIGPGLSQNAQTQGLIRSLIKKSKMPMVIDADGLNAIADHLDVLRTTHNVRRTTTITPHPGEMARLTHTSAAIIQKKRKIVAQRFSDEYNITTVLKGSKTVVASPGKKVYINSTGNPGMASGGSGDVLVGMIAAFLAQGMDGFKAARLAVYVHGLAGDIAAREKGEISLRAGDLLKFLPQAFKKVYG